MGSRIFILLTLIQLAVILILGIELLRIRRDINTIKDQRLQINEHLAEVATHLWEIEKAVVNDPTPVSFAP